MRLKQTRVRPFLIRPREVTKDNEGVPVVSYGDAVTVTGEIWPATSRRQIEQYGDRINGIQEMHVEGDYSVAVIGHETVINTASGITLRLGDGVYVFATEDQEPDYEIVAFTAYHPLHMEVEHRG